MLLRWGGGVRVRGIIYDADLPYLTQAVFSKLAPLGATEVVPGVDRIFPAASAPAAKVVLKELYPLPAVDTRNEEYVIRLPISRILTRAFDSRHYQTSRRICLTIPLYT